MFEQAPKDGNRKFSEEHAAAFLKQYVFAEGTANRTRPSTLAGWLSADFTYGKPYWESAGVTAELANAQVFRVVDYSVAERGNGQPTTRLLGRMVVGDDVRVLLPHPDTSELIEEFAEPYSLATVAGALEVVTHRAETAQAIAEMEKQF
jgi:hypothetical protein